MSWEKSIDGASMAQYRGNKTGTSFQPTSAIAAYIIDTLEAKLPSIRDRVGDTPVSYYWFHPNNPQTEMQSPSVGVSVRAEEHETLGIGIATSYGSVIPGSMMSGEISMFIVADTPRQKEELSARIFKVLNKVIHREEKTPIFYIRRSQYGYDGGFRATYSFDFPALFQTVTEDKYIKHDLYRIGYLENYVDEEDEVDWAIIGRIDIDRDGDGSELTFPINSISLRVSFTPNLS